MKIPNMIPDELKLEMLEEALGLKTDYLIYTHVDDIAEVVTCKTPVYYVPQIVDATGGYIPIKHRICSLTLKSPSNRVDLSHSFRSVYNLEVFFIIHLGIIYVIPVDLKVCIDED